LRGEYEKAQELYQETLNISKELGDRSGIAKSLHQLGNIAYLRGEYEKAQELYQENLKIKKELGDRSGIAISLHQLGIIAQERGEYAQAVKLVAQAFAIFSELGSPEAEIATGTLARLRKKIGKRRLEKLLAKITEIEVVRRDG